MKNLKSKLWIRTRAGLPLKKGRCGTMTHDYVRHGTTTLFAALSVLDGTVIGSCFERHRHEEFLKFLHEVDRASPAEMDLHLIVDNYATHKLPKSKLDPAPSALPFAFYRDQFVLVKFGGEMVWRNHPQTNSPRRLQKR
jgi:hypothetical protein